jgi:hypothetical protein
MLPDTCLIIAVEEPDVRIDFNYILPVLSLSGRVTVDGEPFSGALLSWCLHTEVISETDSLGYYEIDGLSCGISVSGRCAVNWFS